MTIYFIPPLYVAKISHIVMEVILLLTESTALTLDRWSWTVEKKELPNIFACVRIVKSVLSVTVLIAKCTKFRPKVARMDLYKLDDSVHYLFIIIIQYVAPIFF